ncbi:MAG: Mrp/NBP35 family ATP-binding protein [Nanoarchaeota archaeon]|nr:Mrp/NBP35 family ATP-binding protein [Nanoarchaeota archaeon]MBU1005733.1 Mrp/NBP35 family ATP-binding protein [Nanoarchaeota archaeon]MBU1945582.1 Mrp/NBP35 family ATP-binding protein [Nanoarchaeota archaeon]
MNKVKNRILVLSGKGGVGKTTVAVNLALSLALSGKKTGILDADIHGPNVPKMLGLEDEKIKSKGNFMLPIEHKSKLKVISLGFLINEKDSVIWRGPMKHNLIKQFVDNVDWEELDYLIIDFPPGTGDEQISAAQLIGKITGAVIVSTPQKVAILDSVRTIDFCRKMNIPLIGIIENMSGGIFGKGTIAKIADENNIPFLGCLILDKEIAESGDNGKPFISDNSLSSDSFKAITNKILGACKNG